MMSGRVRSSVRVQPAEAARYVASLLLGAFLAGTSVFMLMHRSPDQPGTGPCADAAESWAQIDATARWEYEPVRPGSNVYAPSDALVAARGRAALLLEDCRAAGQ